VSVSGNEMILKQKVKIGAVKKFYRRCLCIFVATFLISIFEKLKNKIRNFVHRTFDNEPVCFSIVEINFAVF